MLSQYHDVIVALPRRAAARAAAHLGLPPVAGRGLIRLLERGGFCQADLALALLHVQEYAACETLVGRPIVHCPPQTPPQPLRPLPRTIKPIVAKVVQNPRLPTTDSWYRFKLVRAGLSVDQLIARGVRKRDIREWVREGSVELRLA